MPEPALYQLDWLARTQEAKAMMDAALHGLGEEREREDLTARTRLRLLRLTAAVEAMRGAVGTLMAPLVDRDDHLPFPLRPPRLGPEAASSVLQQYENVFRDWAWGENEVQRQWDVLKPMLPTVGVRCVAVYGAGAGRLAAQLHEHVAPARTFALDINPLPLIIAGRITQGETLELPEFPVAPRDEEQVAVLHKLRAARPCPEGLTFVFADALTPPFAPASLDVVVTPWFIDTVGVELAVTLSAINRALRVGGHWLNLGPLLFNGSTRGQHAIGEVLDIAAATGFEVLVHGQYDAPYFRSPHSASSRHEAQYWFSACKRADAVRPERPSRQPAWLRDTQLPVPTSQQISDLHRSSLFTMGVLSMVDGKRSIVDMAAQLARAWNQPPGSVETHLRSFFETLFAR